MNKQKPKKPKQDKEYKYRRRCPNCNHYLGNIQFIRECQKYCENCGQKIDWGKGKRMRIYAIYSVTGEYEDMTTCLVEAHTNPNIAKERLHALKLEEEQRIVRCTYCQECPYYDSIGEDYTNGGSKEIIDAMNCRCPNGIGHHYVDANGYLHCTDYEGFGDDTSYYIEEIEVIED